MTLAAPWALVGLAALPLIWWLHRRLRRPPEVWLPSLMFLQDEEDANTLPRGRPFDAELLLALAAAGLLALAAAGPGLVRTRAHRVVRVVVSGGTAASARGYEARVQAALADIRAGLDAADVLHVEHVPARPEPGVFVPRPAPETLLGAARGGDASVRVVISDTGAPAETGDVRWVAAGEPRATNVGFVAVSVSEGPDANQVFCTIANHGREPARLSVRAESVTPVGTPGSASAGLTIEPGAMGSRTLAVGGTPASLTLWLSRADGGDLDDHLAADDTVELHREPLPVRLDPRLSDRHASIRLALQAVLGRAGVQALPEAAAAQADLAFVRRGAPQPAFGAHTWLVELQPTREGDAVVHAEAGTNPLGRDPIARDLSAAGVDWVYAAGAEAVMDGEAVLLLRRGARPWPVVLRRGRTVRLAPDPWAGAPAAVDGPFWPLFLQNLVGLSGHGGDVGLGFRARGLLDAPTTRLGLATSPFEPAWIADAPPTVPARARPLRPFLILGALACMLVLWGAPRLRRRLSRWSAPRPA